MNIRERDLVAIEELGYTRDEARFLYMVATHSGYFQPRQYVSANGLSWGKRSQHFTDKLLSRGHATWREYQGMGGVYHLFSKTLYRRIDKTDFRNRRRHSAGQRVGDRADGGNDLEPSPSFEPQLDAVA